MDTNEGSIWNELWLLWCLENYEEEEIRTPERNINQKLWYNSHIRDMNKPVHYKTWEVNGIRWVNDLLYEDENLKLRFLKLRELKEFYNISLNPCMQIPGAKTSHPKSMDKSPENT